MSNKLRGRGRLGCKRGALVGRTSAAGGEGAEGASAGGAGGGGAASQRPTVGSQQVCSVSSSLLLDLLES